MVHPVAHAEKVNLEFVPPADDSGFRQAIVVSCELHAITRGLCVVEQQATDNKVLAFDHY